MPTRRFALLLLLPLLAALFALAALPALARAEEQHQVQEGEDLEGYVPGAARLEGRIMAPCCWTQTIDIHGSEPAYELRREIRHRLKAGETADVIEASLVKRYGPKILAVPDSSPLGSMAAFLALGFGAAGVGGYYMLKGWTRRADGGKKKKAGKGGASEPERDALDDRLDRELAELADKA